MGFEPPQNVMVLNSRRQLERPIATALSSATFIPPLAAVAADTVCYIRQHAAAVEADLLPHLNKIFMEVTGLVVFDTRLQALQVF